MGWNINYNGNNAGRTTYKTYHTPSGPVAGTIVTLIGLAMLAGGGYFGLKTLDLVSHGIHAQGKIADVKQSTRTESHKRNGYTETRQVTVYTYMVDFSDSKGTSIEFKDGMSDGGHATHQKGDAVDVIYLEKDPKGSASLDHGAMNWMLPGIFGFMGLFITGAGIAAFMRKPKPSGPDQYKVG